MADNYRTQASNYPSGFNNVTIRGVPITQSHPGQVFWVSNATTVLPGQIGGSNGNDGTFNAPFSTINYAVNTACTASRGDIVFVKPGHTETIAAATEVTLATAGVAVIGLGSGSLRPTLTFTAVASNIPVTAADVSMQNFLLYSTRATAFTTSAFTTTGTALSPGLTLDNIEFRDSSSITGFLAGYTSNATATSWDGFTMNNCQFNSGGGVLTRTAVVGLIACDRLILTNNRGASLQTTVAMLMTASDKNMTNCLIAHNYFEGAHTSTSLACGISGTGTAWSGTAIGNRFFSLAGSTGIWIPTTTKLALDDNYSPIAGAYATQMALNPVRA